MANLSAIPGQIRRTLYTTQISVVRPTTTNGLTVTSDSSWTAGAWVQASSSGDTTLNSVAMIAVLATVTAADYGLYFEIGTGAAGSETVAGRVPIAITPAAQGKFYPLIPGIQIPTGARTALRLVGSSTTATASAVSVLYMPRPY